MARFSTAQKETLRKMAEEGKLATSQVQNIMRNAAELKKLNEGGVVGFNRGGSSPRFLSPGSRGGDIPSRTPSPQLPEAPGSAPTPVQDPGEFTETDPGTYQHTQNWVTGDTERAELKNNITGDIKYTGNHAAGDKNAVAQEAITMLESLNAPKREYDTNKSEYDTNKAAFDKYETDLKEYQDKAKAYQEANLKGQQELAQSAITDPTSLVTEADVETIDPAASGTTIAAGTGQVTGTAPQVTAETAGTATTAAAPTDITAETVTASTAQGKVEEAVEDVTAAKGEVSTEAQVTAAQGEVSEGAKADAAKMDPEYVKEVTSGERQVSSDELAAAQGLDEEAVKTEIAEANVPDNIQAAQTTVQPEEIPEPAQIAESEMAAAEAMTMEGLTDDATAVAAKLKSFNVDDGTLAEFKEGKIEAQDTVQGQLASLMKQFDDGTPVWAAGAMRAANSAMAARGLGASSMAGAAILQAAMESALPIASKDADAFRGMKLDNFNRQQQISLANAAAQQGVELANLNAEQQVALQNSQNAFSLQSQNLSNMQQTVIANAQIKAT